MTSLRVIGGSVFAFGMATANAALAQTETPIPYTYRGHMWGDGYGWHSMGYGVMFIFWIVVIALVVLAVRWVGDRNGSSGGGNAALDILKERLARGEIEPAEYEERRKALGK